MRSSIYFVKNVFFQFKQARQYGLTSYEVKVRQDILIIGVYTFKTMQQKELVFNFRPSQTTKRSNFGHLSSRTRTRNSKIKISSDYLKETMKNYKHFGPLNITETKLAQNLPQSIFRLLVYCRESQYTLILIVSEA